ncbi:MAG: vanadium-dependent haloperoxidase [Planctomycetota bacterium]
MTQDRVVQARRIRNDAAHLAEHRDHPKHRANGDEQRYGSARYAMSFSKGLDHDPETGLVKSKQHFEEFRHAIDAGRIAAFTTKVPVPRKEPRRQWEAPTAGTSFDLLGPDAQAVTMPPSPKLQSDELAFEMAEVYELAKLRDTPLLAFDQGGGVGSGDLNEAITRLNGLEYATQGFKGRPRKTVAGGKLGRQTAFRGSSPGVEVGPYLTQFLLIGNKNQAGTTEVKDGYINYGALAVSQKVLSPKPGLDYMQRWKDWFRVQQGYDVNDGGPGQEFVERRFIYTPRDLATYVHFDALYQSYLNACLLLLEMKAPFDPTFANLSGMRNFFDGAEETSVKPNAGGFALYGGPHILTLVTEVATRALKAVRFQKFNNHLRLRPEALAARIEKDKEIDALYPSTCGAFIELRNGIKETVTVIEHLNKSATNGGDPTALLPMAFAEGSPMHPSYGAGHATVAGACVTMLKAFFDTGSIFVKDKDDNIGFTTDVEEAEPVQFEVVEKGKKLDLRKAECCPLTLEGELNKLAANISIGRNMAGVHFFSDYYDSLRMGEQIALGILEEQALCYPTDEFVMTVPTFDGEIIRIGAR